MSKMIKLLNQSKRSREKASESDSKNQDTSVKEVSPVINPANERVSFFDFKDLRLIGLTGVCCVMLTVLIWMSLSMHQQMRAIKQTNHQLVSMLENRSDDSMALANSIEQWQIQNKKEIDSLLLKIDELSDQLVVQREKFNENQKNVQTLLVQYHDFNERINDLQVNNRTILNKFISLNQEVKELQKHTHSAAVSTY